MASTDNQQNLVQDELERPPSPFLTSASLPGGQRNGPVLVPNSESVRSKEHEVSRRVAKFGPSTSTTLPAKPGIIPQKQRKLCPYWYHFGECTKSDEECKYSHALRPEITQTVAFMPKARDQNHACGLPLCKYKDGLPPKPAPTQPKIKSTSKTNPAQPLPVKVPPPPLQQAKKTTNVNNKRPFVALQCDTPTSLQKRTKFMDYDDIVYDIGGDGGTWGNNDCKLTCFFWYHGHCGRSEDERTGFKCNFKHGLTDPPTMVQPPPKYTHRSMCTLEWCPGDARDPKPRRDSASLVVGEDKSAAEDALEDAATTATVAAPVEDWYLKGFDQVE